MSTLLILGRSPIIDSYKEHINYLTEMYETVGINSIATVFNTKYWAFVDETFKTYVNKIDHSKKLITLNKYIGLSEHYEGEFYDTFRPHKKDTDYIKDEKLAYFGFTHDLCISWAISKGYKNVVLVGAADFSTNVYAEVQANVDTPIFYRNQNVEDGSIKAIEEFFSKFISIYTINENSSLNVPRITLQELYNKSIN